MMGYHIPVTFPDVTFPTKPDDATDLAKIVALSSWDCCRCTKTVGHDGLHNGPHGNLENHQFLSTAAEFELKDRKCVLILISKTFLRIGLVP